VNNAAFLVCVFCTFAMTGLIWLIQIVQYPLMSEVGESSFVRYERAHCDRITPIVLPLMTAELLGAAFLVWRPLPGHSGMLVAAFAALLLIWASTFFLQVPLHNRLCQAFDAELHRRLVLTNWIRTVLWSARSAMMFWILWQRVTPIAVE
jgi:hypothetical protein